MSSTGTPEQYLQALAQELKLPLLQIARQAELAQAEPATDLLKGIELSAAQALWVVDSYVLSRQLQEQSQLELEPVTVSAALHDVAHQLTGLARQYNCELELQISGRYGPVMAHPQALRAALVGLGSTLIAADDTKETAHRLVLAAHKSRAGIVAGMFSRTEGLSQAMYRRGRALYGQARQPLNEFSAQGGAGVFVADSLLALMQAQLRVARHHKLTGLAATLQPSPQLTLM